MRYLISAVALLALLSLSIVAVAHTPTRDTLTLSPGDVQPVVCEDGSRPGTHRHGNQVDVYCAGEAPTPTPEPTATNTPTATPEPTATATPEPTPTNTPTSGHDVTVWHGPDGNTHEHGDLPPAWLPTDGPCAGVAWGIVVTGREAHNFYKGYEVVTSNGVRFYEINHIAPTPAGRSHGDHDHSIVALDLAGNYSCWSGTSNYSATDDPTDPIPLHRKRADNGDPGTRPIILGTDAISYEQGLPACESWYGMGPGATDAATHICGPWTDLDGTRIGDGTHRHIEFSMYANRLPGPDAVYIAPTFAESCVVTFNVCGWKAVSTFGKDYGSASGPN